MAMLATLDGQSLRLEELSGLDLVHQTVDSYLGLFEDPDNDERALLVMWGSTFPSSSSVEGMVEADRHGYDSISEVITSGQQDESIRCDVDSTASAVLVLGMMRGIAALLLTDAAITDMTLVRRTCAEWITASLSTGQGSDASGLLHPWLQPNRH